MSNCVAQRALGWAFVLGCSGLAPLAASAHDMKMDMGGGPRARRQRRVRCPPPLWLVSARGEHVVLQPAADPGTPLGAPVVVNAKPEAVYATGGNSPKIACSPGRRGVRAVGANNPQRARSATCASHEPVMAARRLLRRSR